MSSHPESLGNVDRALFVSSLWLRVGFIGASAIATGLLGLMDVESSSLSAFVLVLSGSVLAIVGWHRGRKMLDVIERADEVRPTRDIVLSPEMIERRGQT